MRGDRAARLTKADTNAPQLGLSAAMRAIMLDALAKGAGQTLSKNSTLREKLGISPGTAQRALDVLAEQGAMTTVSRGHQGRKIESIDVGAGWRTARLSPIRVVLSPAGAVEMDALESAIGDGLSELGIPHTVQHLRGGVPRLVAVRDGAHDLTAVSAGTLRGMRDTAGTPWDGPIKTLPPGTYYAQDRLVTVRRAGSSQASLTTIAIDRDSFDHEALTLAEFPSSDSCQYIDVAFPDVPAYVAAGIADAGVWHITRSSVPVDLAGLILIPLARSKTHAVREGLSGAELVAWSGRPEIRAVLGALQLGRLIGHQQQGFAEEEARAALLARARESAAPRR